MRPQKVEREEVLKGLMEVLRTKGFEGARLDDFSKATGLNKASLYNRFPEGKKKMATVILDYINEGVKENIFKLLSDREIKPELRLKNAINHINVFYNNGTETCIIRAMSLDSGIALFGEQIARSIDTWLKGFEILGEDFGMSSAEAKSKALNTLILIQGALVISKGTNSTDAFQLAMTQIKTLYL